MALQNTNERYQYIYGNNVRKLDTFAPDYEAKAQPKEQPSVQRRKKAKPATRLVTDWKYTFMTLFGILVIAVGAVGYVGESVYINNLDRKITQLQHEKKLLEAKRDALKYEIDKSINLEEIGEYAETELDMVYPDADHIITYDMGSNDYFRQYESVRASKNR